MSKIVSSSFLLNIIFGAWIFILLSEFHVEDLRNPLPMDIPRNTEHRFSVEEPLQIPRRRSNYTVVSSNMTVRPGDIPDWLSCPPATTAHSIWSMAVTEKEALYSRVLALSLKVSSILKSPSKRENFRKIGVRPTFSPI